MLSIICTLSYDGEHAYKKKMNELTFICLGICVHNNVYAQFECASIEIQMEQKHAKEL